MEEYGHRIAFTDQEQKIYLYLPPEFGSKPSTESQDGYQINSGQTLLILDTSSIVEGQTTKGKYEAPPTETSTASNGDLHAIAEGKSLPNRPEHSKRLKPNEEFENHSKHIEIVSHMLEGDALGTKRSDKNKQDRLINLVSLPTAGHSKDTNADFEREEYEQSFPSRLQTNLDQSQTPIGNKKNTKDDRYKKKFDCSVCGCVFVGEKQFYGHLRIHAGDVNWKCSQCPEAPETMFETRSRLRKHENLFHNVVRPFECSCCKMVFDRLSQLDNHRRSVHQRERSQVCQICGKGFFRYTDLRTHLNIHLGTNRCICEVCGRKFSHASNLTRHGRTHAGVKPYPCTVCGKRFSQVNSLVRHKAIHDRGEESVECYFCERQYKGEISLKEHMKRSHGYTQNSVKDRNKITIRQHYCKICGESFQFVQLLRQHVKNHSDVETLECKSCKKTFRKADELKEHSCGVPESQSVEKTRLKKINTFKKLTSKTSQDEIKSIKMGDNECVLTQLEDKNENTSIEEFIIRNRITKSVNADDQDILGKDLKFYPDEAKNDKLRELQNRETVVYPTSEQFAEMNLRQVQEDTANNFLQEHLMELRRGNSVLGSSVYMETDGENIISDILNSYSKDIELPNIIKAEMNINLRNGEHEPGLIYVQTSERDVLTLYAKDGNTVRNSTLELISEKQENGNNNFKRVDSLHLQADASQSETVQFMKNDNDKGSHILEANNIETISMASVNKESDINKSIDYFINGDMVLIRDTDWTENQRRSFIGSSGNPENSKNDSREPRELGKRKTEKSFTPDVNQRNESDKLENSNQSEVLLSTNETTNFNTRLDQGSEEVVRIDRKTRSAKNKRNLDDLRDLKFANACSKRQEPTLRLVQTDNGQQFYELVINNSPEKSQNVREVDKTSTAEYYEGMKTPRKDPVSESTLKLVQTEMGQQFFELARSISPGKTYDSKRIIEQDEPEGFMLNVERSKLHGADPQNITEEGRTVNLPRSRNDQFFFLAEKNKESLTDNYQMRKSDGNNSNSVDEKYMQNVSRTSFESLRSLNEGEDLRNFSVQDKQAEHLFETVQDNDRNGDDNDIGNIAAKQAEIPPMLRLVQNEDGEQFFELIHGDLDFEENLNLELVRTATDTASIDEIQNDSPDRSVRTGDRTTRPTTSDLQRCEEAMTDSNPVKKNRKKLENAGPKIQKQKSIVKKYHCEVCEKSFSKGYNYRQHIGTHFADRQMFKCEECGVFFAWKSTLNKHMASHRADGQQKFVCQICPKVYTTLSQVNEHVKRDHLKERNHECPHCSKTFFKKFDLKTHIRTHTKERPYVCRACGKSFHHQSHIIRHERIHSGEKPYSCNICERTFTQLGSLKIHRQRHRRTKIDILDYRMDEDDPSVLSAL